MTYKYKIFIAIVTLLFFSRIAAAKNMNGELSLSDVVISGKIIDSFINTMPNSETKLKIMISKYPFHLFYMQRGENITYQRTVRNNQEFRIVIPSPATRFYMYISYETNPIRFWSFFDNIYMLEHGDRIKCMISPEIFSFTGKGSEKLNCQSDLYKIKIVDESRQALRNSEQNIRFIKNDDQSRDSCFFLQKKIIEKYSPKLGKEISDIMLINCMGSRYFTALREARLIANDLDYYNAFLNSSGYINFNSNLSDYQKMSPKSLVAAPLYTDMIFEKIMMDTRLVIDGKAEFNTSPSHIEEVYQTIVNDYTGIIRDKLLATLFLQWNTEPSILDYLDQSLSIMQDNAFKDVILKIKQGNTKGTLFFPFELENSNGKIVKLKDLYDQILIIDFWYTGCVACANLKSAMQGVWDTYKDNPKVKFVSISIDKDKETWKKSILSKKYTEPDAINLYTGGLGNEHPIISKLHITGYPQIYIVKDCKLYSANMPRPIDPDTSKGKTKEFIDIIKNAIAE